MYEHAPANTHHTQNRIILMCERERVCVYVFLNSYDCLDFVFVSSNNAEYRPRFRLNSTHTRSQFLLNYAATHP